VYDNGESRNLARVALANFENSSGLLQAGSSLFRVSNNSGDPRIGAPGEQGMGAILPGSLEMSNVDLSEEFTDMIVTQRGFQANSRLITTSDEMLQELVNLKR
ncbi:MAG: flagellar hook-basal body complex protein, partial [Syntrophomonadaceae bacterium]|nr:flagellar hook-basal body complex protein [Syntrophomonadaceae bacterium]